MLSIWTESYIVHNGKKIYLETNYSELKEKMKNKDKTIELNVSGFLFGSTRVFKKTNISEFGESGII